MRTNPEPELRKRAHRAVSDVFDQFSTPQERSQAVLYKLADFVRAGVLGEAEVAQVQAAETSEDKEAWVAEILQVLEPIVQMQINQPAEYESILRANTIRIAVEQNGSVQLNEVVYYDRDSHGWAHLHLAPSVHVRGKLGLIKDALQQLAVVAQADPDFKGVAGTSWIVGAHERILERFGFTIEGEISAEDRERGFSHEDADTSIKRARISKEELIRRYGA